MFCAALFLTAQLLHSAAASGSNDTAVIYEWLSRVSGDRDNDGIDCESTNNPNGYIPSAPVEPPVETSTCSADAETWRGLKVCDERPRDGDDRDAFGTSYSSLEGEIIAALPPTMKANGQVYTPYSCLAFDITPDGTAATDIEHIVAPPGRGRNPTRPRLVRGRALAAVLGGASAQDAPGAPGRPSGWRGQDLVRPLSAL